MLANDGFTVFPKTEQKWHRTQKPSNGKALARFLGSGYTLPHCMVDLDLIAPLCLRREASKLI